MLDQGGSLVSPSLGSQGTLGWDALDAGSQRRLLQLGCRGESFGCALARKLLVFESIEGSFLFISPIPNVLAGLGASPRASRARRGANPLQEGLLLGEAKHRSVPWED